MNQNTKHKTRNIKRETRNIKRETQIANRAAQSVDVKSLKIDTRTRRVWKDGTGIELTKLEYAVLEYLARRAGKVARYDELWREVWQQTTPLADGEQQTVRQVIKRVRRKLGEDWQTPRFLWCVRDVGFRCVAQDVEVVG